jgi:hypothetical protein
MSETNLIKFYPHESYDQSLMSATVTKPIKAASSIPTWFKDIPRFHNDDKQMVADSASGYHNLTVRHCMPFVDSMTSGYFLTTWTDIYVKRDDAGDPIIGYKDLENVEKFGFGLIQYQKYFPSHLADMPGFDPFLYAWSIYWRIETPPGVSCLFTQPLNRTDLPFFTLSGVTDTDAWGGSDVLNFALKKDFEGVIPAGTPIVQIIPFRREIWDVTILDQADMDRKPVRDKVNDLRMNQTKSGYYRDNLHTRKRY